MAVGSGVQESASSTCISQYKECQIHGEVALATHVRAFVINDAFKNRAKDLEALSKRHNVPFFWMSTFKSSQLTGKIAR